jgi:hypothetical protein
VCGIQDCYSCCLRLLLLLLQRCSCSSGTVTLVKAQLLLRGCEVESAAHCESASGTLAWTPMSLGCSCNGHRNAHANQQCRCHHQDTHCWVNQLQQKALADALVNSIQYGQTLTRYSNCWACHCCVAGGLEHSPEGPRIWRTSTRPLHGCVEISLHHQ